MSRRGRQFADGLMIGAGVMALLCWLTVWLWTLVAR